VGLVCEPNTESIAQTMITMQEQGTFQFLTGLQEEKKKYTWNNITNVIMSLAGYKL
jgi:hypothetical protein